MNLIPTRLKNWLLSKLPVARQTIFDPRSQVQGVAPTVDVDRVHGIMSEADAGNPVDLFALYQEIMLSNSHLLGEYGKRLLAVLGDVVNVTPRDAKNADDVATADFIRAQIEDCTTFLDGCKHLLSSVLWPVAVVEKVFAPMEGGGFRLKKLIPVPDQLLDFSLGRLRIRATNDHGLPMGQYHEPTADRYITHRGHLLSAPDSRGGPMRSLVWWWLLATMDREWWGRFLDRFGMPFLVGKFDQGDEQSQSILSRAFSYATRLGGLVVTTATQVEVMQAAAAPTGDAFERFLSVAHREISKLIVGQTLSAESQPTGIGGGASGQQEEVRQDIRQFDAMLLGNTLRTQLLAQLCAVNRLTGAVPSITWGGESPMAAEATAAMIASLAQAGITVADDALDALGDRIGFALQRTAPASPVAGFGGIERNSGEGGRWITANGTPVFIADGSTAAESISKQFGEHAPAREKVTDKRKLKRMNIDEAHRLMAQRGFTYVAGSKHNRSEPIPVEERKSKPGSRRQATWRTKYAFQDKDGKEHVFDSDEIAHLVSNSAEVVGDVELNASLSSSLAELADDANDRIARAGAADLAQAFSGALAPVARLIRNSASLADLEHGLATLFPKLPVGRAATLLENAAVAFAANRAAQS